MLTTLLGMPSSRWRRVRRGRPQSLGSVASLGRVTWLLHVVVLAFVALVLHVPSCGAAGSSSSIGATVVGAGKGVSNASGTGGFARVPRPEDSANGEGVAGFLAFQLLVLAAFAASQLSLRRQRDRKSRAYYKMVRTSSDKENGAGSSSSNARRTNGKLEVELTDIP